MSHNHGHLCSGCGVVIAFAQNAIAERVEMRSGDGKTRLYVKTLRWFCKDCITKRIEEIDSQVGGQVSLLG